MNNLLARIQIRRLVTKEQIARKLGIQPSFLDDVCSGRASIPNELVGKIKDIYHLDLNSEKDCAPLTFMERHSGTIIFIDFVAVAEVTILYGLELAKRGIDFSPFIVFNSLLLGLFVFSLFLSIIYRKHILSAVTWVITIGLTVPLGYFFVVAYYFVIHFF